MGKTLDLSLGERKSLRKLPRAGKHLKNQSEWAGQRRRNGISGREHNMGKGMAMRDKISWV